MTDTEIRNPASAYFKWKMPVIVKSEDDWNFWNTEDKYNRTMFIGYNDLTTPHVASLFIIVDGKAVQAVGDDIIARIAQQEKDISEALTDIQALVDRVNEQQMGIEQLKIECSQLIQTAQDYVDDAQTWAEGSDEDIAELGGEHSAKGWAKVANDIVASGLPADASFDHITVTGSSKFGKDPDREDQPGLEIEGTGEIQAYRPVNMHNGGTIEYDGTVEMPWSDSSNKIPNTEWVQKAVMHGTIDPNTELTIKALTLTNGILKQDHTKTQDDGTYRNPKVHFESDAEKFWVKCEAIPDYPRSIELLMMPQYSDTRQEHFTVTAKESTTTGKFDFSATGFILSTKNGACSIVSGTPSSRKDIVITTQQGQLFVPPVAVSENSRKNVYAATTKYVHDAIKADSAEITAGLQPKLTAGVGIEISADNVISATGGSGAVTSVNGKTGEVILAASDVGAATADDIMTALEPYAKTVDVTTALADYARSADVTSEIATATAGLQPKLTAGANITISEDTVISATGGAVDSVNGKTGEVVLTGADISLGDYEGAPSVELVVNSMGSYIPSGVSSDNQLVSNEGMTSAIEDALTPYATTEALNAAIAPLATTASVDTALAGKQDTMTQADVTTLLVDSATSIKSLTVNETGSNKSVTISDGIVRLRDSSADYVITLNATEGAIYTPRTWDADDSSTKVGNTQWTQNAIRLATGGLQPKLTAGDGIAISADNVISTTGGGSGGGDVASVNGKTGTVVLTAEDIAMGPSDPTTVKANSDAISSLLLGKQDALTTTSDIAVNSVKASAFSVMDDDTADLKLSVDTSSFLAYQGYIQLGKDDNAFGTMNGTWFINSVTMMSVISGPQVNMTRGFLGQLQGGSNPDDTGQFDWYMNNTTDFNKFNIYSRRWVTSTDTETGESTTTAEDVQVMSAGGSPYDGSTWIDFTANYLSFKGAANFGETGMASHTMNFNGASTFYASATFLEGFTLSINEYGEYTDGITWMPRKNASTFGLTAQAPIYIEGWDTTTYTNNLVKLKGCGLAMMDSTGTNTFFKLITNDTIGQVQVNGSMFVTGAGNLLFIRQGAGLVVQDANLNVLMDTTVAGQINFDSNVRLGSTAFDSTDESGNVTGHVDATNIWVNGAALFYSGLTCMSGAPAAFSDNVTFYKTDADGSIMPAATFTASTGSFAIDRVDATDGGTGEARLAWDADSRNTDTYGMHVNMPVEITATMPAATDSSTTVPTTAWVQSAIAAGGVSTAINNAKPAAAFSTSESARQVIRSETCSDGSKLCTVYWHGPATNGTAINVTMPAAVSNGIVASVVITPESAGMAGASATLTDTTLAIMPALATDGNVSITVVVYHEA